MAAELTGLGAQVTVAACDVSDQDVLAEVIDGISPDRPLTAVFHAAGGRRPEVHDGDRLRKVAEVLGAKDVAR